MRGPCVNKNVWPWPTDSHLISIKNKNVSINKLTFLLVDHFEHFTYQKLHLEEWAVSPQKFSACSLYFYDYRWLRFVVFPAVFRGVLFKKVHKKLIKIRERRLFTAILALLWCVVKGAFRAVTTHEVRLACFSCATRSWRTDASVSVLNE